MVLVVSSLVMAEFSEQNKFEKTNDYIYKEKEMFVKAEARTLPQCASRCLNIKQCSSFTFSGKCQLLEMICTKHEKIYQQTSSIYDGSYYKRKSLVSAGDIPNALLAKGM